MAHIKELRKMSAKDLDIELAKARYQAGNISFAVKAGQSKSTHTLRNVKRFIARILTVKRELELKELANKDK